MHVERARPADAEAIEGLLTAAALPIDGAAEAFGTGLVARDGEAIVGAAAIEPYGDAGLLRSVVVAPDRRGSGIGGSLVDASEGLASELGINELYLLTDTAEAWFAGHGYRRTEREDVPERVRSSIEFTTACSDTAVAMKRRLGS
jgi:amino-acid N-acetyltransferase